jgi:hypothetical protein
MRTSNPEFVLFASFACACLAGFGCVNNPVHDDEVAALGPEAANVPPGPLHRPGQPCLVCHGPYGPAELQFSVAGTVYAATGESTPAVGAIAKIEDSTGASVTADTNAAGNFYILLRDFDPAYPILPQVSSPDGGIVQKMMTYVARNGSCGDCHASLPGPASAGPVVLVVSTAPDGGLDGAP